MIKAGAMIKTGAMIRIGIDASCWHNNRGFGRFTRELLGEIFKYSEQYQFIAFADEARPGDVPDRVDWRMVSAGRRVVDAAVADGRRSIGDVLAFRREAAKANLDVMFYPAVYSWFPPPRNVPSVVTIHDAIAEHFPELVFPHAKERALWTAKTWLAKKSARRVLTVSQAAKREIIEYMNIKPAKIDVICEGASAVFTPVSDMALRRRVMAELELPEQAKTLVYIGGFAPHKNLLRLLSAFESACEVTGGEDLRLVLVGDPGGGGFHSEYGKMVRQIEASPTLSRTVVLAGYLSDVDMAALLSGATALVMPSLSEGFGLPALEAMCCGTPVLAAQDGAVMEVAGKAGLAFDPLDVASIAEAIGRIASDDKLRAALCAATASEAARNTWQQSAKLTLATLAAVGGK